MEPASLRSILTYTPGPAVPAAVSGAVASGVVVSGPSVRRVQPVMKAAVSSTAAISKIVMVLL